MTIFIRLFLTVLIALALVSPVAVQHSVGQKDTQNQTITSKKGETADLRVRILSEYLAKHNSPMQASAKDFVEAADKHNIDWKLVPAIAGVESTFGKFVPGGSQTPTSSYNAWGWGVYGTQAIYFKSWRDGIFTVSEGLKTRYIDKGLTNPLAMNKVYAASPTWGVRVAYFLSDIEKFSNHFKALNQSKQPELIIPQVFPEIFPANQPTPNTDFGFLTLPKPKDNKIAFKI